MALHAGTVLYFGVGLGAYFLTDSAPLANAVESMVPMLDNRRARHFAFATVTILWPLWLLYLWLLRPKP